MTRCEPVGPGFYSTASSTQVARRRRQLLAADAFDTTEPVAIKGLEKPEPCPAGTYSNIQTAAQVSALNVNGRLGACTSASAYNRS